MSIPVFVGFVGRANQGDAEKPGHVKLMEFVVEWLVRGSGRMGLVCGM